MSCCFFLAPPLHDLIFIVFPTLQRNVLRKHINNKQMGVCLASLKRQPNTSIVIDFPTVPTKLPPWLNGDLNEAQPQGIESRLLTSLTFLLDVLMLGLSNCQGPVDDT